MAGAVRQNNQKFQVTMTKVATVLLYNYIYVRIYRIDFML